MDVLQPMHRLEERDMSSTLKEAIEGINALNNLILHGGLTEQQTKLAAAAVNKLTRFVYGIKSVVVGK